MYMYLNTKKIIIMSMLIIKTAYLLANNFYINNILISPVGSDFINNENSITFNLKTLNIKSISNWKIGFYMPSTFLSLQNTNPNLVLQICDVNNNCSNLYCDVNKIDQNDLSVGYTTILKPEDPNFLLSANSTYIIKILHSNTIPVGNYSSMPQNFFLITDNKLINIITNKSDYIIAGYDQNKINENINNNIISNWNNSNNVTTPLNVIPAVYSFSPTNSEYIIPNKINLCSSISLDEIDLPNKIITINQSNIYINKNYCNISISKISNSNLLQNNLEGYQIIISNNKIQINILNSIGVLYAFETLKQLMYKKHSIPTGEIIDYPRFKYRGLMLDVVRHFLTIDQLKNVIDIMLSNKLNTLHLHLSDDEGLRLDLSELLPNIFKYTNSYSRGITLPIGPQLLVQGSLDLANIKNLIYPTADKTYSGVYSILDIKELIKYANTRGVTIIPEIDIPAHARAFIKSSTDIFVNYSDKSSYISVQGFTDNVLPICDYNQNNNQFQINFTKTLNQIIYSVIELFNNQKSLYFINNEISLGADESPSNALTDNPFCSSLFQSLPIYEKVHLFFAEVSNNFPDVIFSGWHEMVLNPDLIISKYSIPQKNIGHIWIWSIEQLGINAAINLVSNNYPVVIDFSDKTYLDQTYTPDINEIGFKWANSYSNTYSALTSSISASNIMNGLNPKFNNNLLGIEAVIFSENVASYEDLTYLLLPRLTGISEASWAAEKYTNTANKTDWKDLVKRLGYYDVGYLFFIEAYKNIYYRGFPNGIRLEIPQDIFK